MKYIKKLCSIAAIFMFFPAIVSAYSNSNKFLQTAVLGDEEEVPGIYVYERSHPIREIRAVWLTTIMSLDWPKVKANDALGIERQKAELVRILDQYQKANINTVIFQTRVRGSVIYPSKIEPWEECLTGHPCKDPGYDPLAFAIEECHKRGMELHSWVVCIPLGKVARMNTYGNAAISKKRKDLCKTASGEYFMIPGKPETADYLAKICEEIIDNYDVDGISLDYIRYPESLYKFSDDECYSSASGMNRNDWKRENITRIVRRIHDVVKAKKPWVKLSSSPIGKYNDLVRYSSKGWNCYNAVWQDPQMWLRTNLQDVLFPMMYFKDNHFYPFLLNWKECNYGHPVVPGLGIYFLDPSEGNWVLNDVRQEMHAIRNTGIGGMAFYRSAFLTRNCKGIYDTACDEFFPYPAMTTRMLWMGDTIAPSAPQSIKYANGKVTWDKVTDKKEVLYNVYGANVYPVDVTKAENLLAVNVRSTSFDIKGRASKVRYYAVTSIDRFGNESAPVQEAKSGYVHPEHLNVPYLINRDKAGEKKKTTGKKKKKKRSA